MEVLIIVGVIAAIAAITSAARDRDGNGDGGSNPIIRQNVEFKFMSYDVTMANLSATVWCGLKQRTPIRSPSGITITRIYHSCLGIGYCACYAEIEGPKNFIEDLNGARSKIVEYLINLVAQGQIPTGWIKAIEEWTFGMHLVRTDRKDCKFPVEQRIC